MVIKYPTRIQGPIAVIGDVHGQVDELQAVLEQLAHIPDFEHRWVVFIGDFVDRGPDPKGAVDLFLQVLEQHHRTTAICGNHEYAMAGALGWSDTPHDAAWAERWVQHYDSDTTFESYGVEHGDCEELARQVPERHQQALTKLPWAVWHPQLLFVHAGLDPNTPYELQRRILEQRDLTLHRPQWLFEKSYVQADPPGDCPLTVVSGHVRVPQVQLKPKRILLDTTGGTGGDLSCVLLPERRVITSSGPAVPAIAGSSDRSWW